ncbi:MAG TPA: 3-deoxy-7-phosphoheptulonate synthase [Jatrophihabitans sp.]|nr:3-deoxy-7-phosphoheptulonate synthase [Jatrophihabitans sp.]
MTVLVVVQERTDQADLDRVIELMSAAGSDLRVHSRQILSAAGDRDRIATALAAQDCVLRVASIPGQHALASLQSRMDVPGSVDVGNCRIGPGSFTVIAGPCAVENAEQLLQIAEAVRTAGCHALRGGAFKPRSSPYAFQGRGRPALEMLAEARAMTGLPVVSEIVDVRDLDAMVEVVDLLQVGARNMQNFALLRELGACRTPVLLKRGLSATVDETLLAAEYLLEGGNERVVLCERGIRTFESSYRFTLDLGAIPVLRERTHLPVIVDPSHAAGEARRVIPLALAAAAVGADGIIVESHHDAAQALCDGRQALPVSELDTLMSRLQLATAAAGRVLRLGGRDEHEDVLMDDAPVALAAGLAEPVG